MSKITTGWYKIHRPKSIADYVFQDEASERNFLQYIEQKDFPDLLLAGHRGTGKTTLRYILQNEIGILEIDTLVLNASDSNSVDDIRHKVKPFINTMSMGKFRLVFLDEADALTEQAQEALKSMMEDEDMNARFILTCNKPHKIIPEIRSRCTEYNFTGLDRMSMKRIALSILNEQGMDIGSVDSEELIAVVDAHLELAYPDFRKFITSLEKSYDGTTLHPPSIENMEQFVKILLFIDDDNWLGIRNLIYEELSPDDIGNVYRFINNNLSNIDKCKDNDTNMRKAVVTLAHYAALHNTSAVPELNLSACFVKLCDI